MASIQTMHRFMNMGDGGSSPRQQGGTSLLDIITGSTPKKLQAQQQQFQSSEAEKERQHEVEIEKLKAGIAKDLATSQHFIKLAEAHDIPVDKLAGDYADKLVENSRAKLNLEGNALNPDINKNAQQAANEGVNSKLTGIEPNRVVTTKPGDIASFQLPPGATPAIQKGPTPTVNTFVKKQFQGPNGEMIPMEQEPVTTYSGGGLQMPLTQAEKANVTPPSQSNVNPMPSNFQPSFNGMPLNLQQPSTGIAPNTAIPKFMDEGDVKSQSQQAPIVPQQAPQGVNPMPTQSSFQDSIKNGFNGNIDPNAPLGQLLQFIFSQGQNTDNIPQGPINRIYQGP